MRKLIISVCFISLSAFSQEESWKPNFQLDWYNRGIYRDINDDSFANPDNQFAKIPQQTLESDLRPMFSLEKGSHLVKINPRIITTATKTEYGSEDDQSVIADSFFNEASYQLNLDEHQIVLGLQNYQWGPAEMLSPTNPIFRFLQDQRSLFFQQRGRNLVRWNWTLNKSWSVISMIEVTNNDVDLPREDQHFEPNGLVKIERSLEKTSDYLGVVVGKAPSQENFVGEYGSFGLSDELSIYLDARHQYETNNFYPDHDDSGFQNFTQKYQDSGKIYTLGTVGIRHESRVDIRLEYIYNELGLTEKQWDDAKGALTTATPHIKENIKRFYRSGRDLQKQHYGYFSMRVPDLGKNNIYTVFLRYFNSLQDSSSVSQILVDRATGDNFNLYLEAATYQGAKDADFSLLISTEISAGFKWSY